MGRHLGPGWRVALAACLLLAAAQAGGQDGHAAGGPASGARAGGVHAGHSGTAGMHTTRRGVSAGGQRAGTAQPGTPQPGRSVPGARVHPQGAHSSLRTQSVPGSTSGREQHGRSGPAGSQHPPRAGFAVAQDHGRAGRAGGEQRGRTGPPGGAHRGPGEPGRHLAPAHPPAARPGPERRGWHGDIRHFGERDLGRWHQGHWYHGAHGARSGWWWIVGPTWYFYLSPVYPYPDPYVPAPLLGEPARYWYYCADPPGYYPYIAECLVPWRAVPAQPG